MRGFVSTPSHDTDSRPGGSTAARRGGGFTKIQDRPIPEEGSDGRRSPVREIRVEALGIVSLPDLPDAPLGLPDRDLTVTYPEAPPETYLRWFSYFREVESVMLEHPGLADLALHESGPFLEGDAARLISELVGRLAQQVRHARSQGRAVVAPIITARAQLMAKSVALAETRNAWLEATVDGRPLVEILGLDPIDPEARDLRESAMRAVRDQLASVPIPPG